MALSDGLVRQIDRDTFECILQLSEWDAMHEQFCNLPKPVMFTCELGMPDGNVLVMLDAFLDRPKIRMRRQSTAVN